MTLARLELEQLKTTTPKSDPPCEALKQIASDDAAKLKDRVRQISQRIEFHRHAPEPYLEVITELWNGSVFEIVNLGEISGYATYTGHRLAANPKIIFSTQREVLNLRHGETITLVVRQYLSAEIAKTIEAGRGRGITIDFENVMVRFEIFQQLGIPGQLFKWCGPRFAIEGTEVAL